MAGWFQLAHDIRNSFIYNMLYIILAISVISIFLIITYTSSHKSNSGENEDSISDISISASLQNENSINTIGNDSFLKWKEEHDFRIKEEEERLINGYYDQYRYIEFYVAGIYYRTTLAKETILALDILSDIHFIKEPNNPYDKYAIKITYDRKRIGYVPASESQRISKLIDNKQIHKILIIDSGKDIISEYSDAMLISIRVYYTPTDTELKLEEEIRLKEKEKQELKLKKMSEPVEYPLWLHELIEELKQSSVESEEQKWILKKLRDNIRNSIKSYEKAIRNEKETIADNALKRLMQYRDDFYRLVNK